MLRAICLKHCYANSFLWIPPVLCGLVMAFWFGLSSTTASADVIDDVVITVPAACTFSNTTTDTTHSASINNNHLESDIGTTNFTVYCNDGAGFAIYAIGYSDDTYGNTDMLGATSNTNIATGLATSGPTSAWAMKLIPTAGTFAPTIESDSNGSYANYHIVPTTYTKVATFNTTTDNTVGSNLQSTYRVFASATQPADTYTGKVRYTLVHPASEVPAQPQTTQSGKICYYANASDAVGTMGCQNVSSPVTLLASNFSRNGYGFAGWSDAFDYKTNANAHFYGPSETITLTPADYQSPNNGLSLYAVWIKSEGNLQDWSGCSSLTKADEATNIFSESITALSDSRDNNTYAIAKLADGKCWMIENLRLESTNSDNSTGTLAQGYGTSATYGNFSGLADAEPAWANNSTTANSLYSTDGSSGTINIGTSNAGYRFPRYNHDNTNSRASSPTANSVAMYSYGNYYTWPAAIADTTAYTTNNQSVTNTSICPAGWHLPQGGRKANVSVSDFWILSRATMGADPANFANDYFYYTGTPEGTEASNKMRSYPLNFVYSGRVLSGSVSYRGSDGYFWSSTAYSSNSAYFLYLNSSGVYPGTYSYDKYRGGTIRCVASGA